MKQSAREKTSKEPKSVAVVYENSGLVGVAYTSDQNAHITHAWLRALMFNKSGVGLLIRFSSNTVSVP